MKRRVAIKTLQVSVSYIKKYRMCKLYLQNNRINYISSRTFFQVLYFELKIRPHMVIYATRFDKFNKSCLIGNILDTTLDLGCRCSGPILNCYSTITYLYRKIVVSSIFPIGHDILNLSYRVAYITFPPSNDAFTVYMILQY